jgi:DNA polymerase III psi subunit
MITETGMLEYLYQEELYEFRSPVLILLPSAWEHVNDDEKVLLNKILNSVKLTPAQVRIISKTQFDLQDVAHYQPSRIISFGTAMKEMSALYEHRKIDNVSVILADALHLLDDQKKKSLWLALRQMFGI